MIPICRNKDYVDLNVDCPPVNSYMELDEEGSNRKRAKEVQLTLNTKVWAVEPYKDDWLIHTKNTIQIMCGEK
jgi:hypothetical protein